MQDQNTNSARLVIYYNGQTNLTIQQIAALPYTDINFAFLVPAGPGTSSSDLKLTAKGAWSVLNDLAQNVQTLKNAGKNVLISFGGAVGISSQQYQAYSVDINSLVSDIVSNWVQPYGFSGIDIDFEDTSAFENTGLYNGIDFLSNLTTELAKHLPATQNIITHAPQTPYWGTTFVDQPYVEIWQNVGQHISWVNNQFYNNTGWDGTSTLDIKWYDKIAETCGDKAISR